MPSKKDEDRLPIIGDLTPPKRMPRRRKLPHERMQLSPAERKVFSKMGKLGGAARAAKLDATELSDIGRKAAAVRWKKKRKKKSR